MKINKERIPYASMASIAGCINLPIAIINYYTNFLIGVSINLTAFFICQVIAIYILVAKWE